MELYLFFRDLAILIASAKLLALAARKLHAPQVVGEILAGLIIGPCVLGIVEMTDYISIFAEVGVVLLMYSTGLGTDLRKLIKAGPLAFVIACVGVAVPLLGGTVLYAAFYGLGEIGSAHFYTAVFFGVIMTATSVSITVATLQELGKLSSFVGTTIVSAAVIDDVIGIIVLTCVIGAAGGAKGSSGSVAKVLISTALFFVAALIVGYIIYRIMEWVDERNPHTQRVSIMGLAFCFIMAYAAEAYFGIADITGAYVAGVALCSIHDAGYVSRRVDIGNYLFFAPVFFASIGLKTDLSGLTPTLLVFCIGFVLVALITKIIGCGGVARLCKFSWNDSLKVGISMMTRGEVALIVAQKGLAIGLIEPVYFTAVILLILVSSVATPLCLKMLYRKEEQRA